MEPLIALVTVTGAVRLAGRSAVTPLASWGMALRGGVAAMFTLTGVAHFVGMREDLIAMVPPALPEPALLVTLTGVLELAGAVGVLLAPTAEAAAAGLTILLVVMFPANVHHALTGTVRWDDALVPRTLIQVVFVAATTAVHVGQRRRRLSASEDEVSGACPAPAEGS